MLHRIDKLQELVTAWQCELLRAHRGPFQSFGRVSVYDPCVLCHFQYMAQSRESVVIACWGCHLAKRARPLITICFGDATDFPIRQARPAFQQRDKYLTPIMPRRRFNRHVVGMVLLMDFECLAKSRFGRDFAVAVTHSLAVFFEKLRELGFGDGVMRCLERLPNFFAASKGSGIIAPGLMTEKIRFSGFLPCFSWVCGVS